MTENRLVEIPIEKWPVLRDMFLKDWPNNHVGYYTIDNFIRWTNFDPCIKNLNIYSLNGDWSDGTFAVVDRYQLLINSLNESNERLTQLLLLLNWKNGLKVSSFLKRHRPAVLDAVKSFELEYDSHTVLYFIPREEALKFEISPPDGITLKPLTVDNAELINNEWPNRHQGSLFLIKRLIRWNINIGAFTADGKLVAWCVRLQAGPLGALQVLESHKRLGLGSLMCKAMAKIHAEQNMDTFGLVGHNNMPSRGMFEKCGFKVIDDCYWLRNCPTVPFHWCD